MPQLVGSECASCQQRIHSAIDAELCGECGCPVHLECKERRPQPAPAGTCPACGGSLSHPLGLQLRADREAAALYAERQALLKAQQPTGCRSYVIMGFGLMSCFGGWSFLRDNPPFGSALWIYDVSLIVVGLVGSALASRRPNRKSPDSPEAPPQ